MLTKIKNFNCARNRDAARRAWWLALGTLALLGVFFVLRATTRGVGVSPDSTVYISIARGMLNRLGFQFPLQSGGDFPPLYPALLALGGLVTGDPSTAARPLNAILFGCNILLVGIALQHITRNSFWVPLFGAALMVSAGTMLTIHTMAWSEPLFIFLALSGMIALAQFISSPQLFWLAIAAVAMGLAAVNRYVGISLGLCGIAALIILSPGALRRKIASAIFFAALTLLPLAFWMTRQPTRRMFQIQLPPWDYIRAGLENISMWIVPAGIPFFVHYRAWIVAALVIFLMLGVGYVWRQRANRALPKTVLARVPPLAGIVALFAFAYLGVNILARMFLGPALELHSRALSPIFVAGVILFLSIASFLISFFARKNILLQFGIAVLTMAVLGYSFGAGIRFVERSRVEGLGYNSIAWHTSPTIARIKTLPPHVVVISNGSDAVYFLTGRRVQRTPNKVDKMNMLENQAFLAEMAQVKNRLASGRAVIVYFNTFPDRWYQPNEQELMQDLPLRLIVREADGAIFQ